MWVALLCTVTAVIFVNGWTDAPNAITNVVVTGSLSYRAAAALAAVCNALGTLCGVLLGGEVMKRVAGLVSFAGAQGEAHRAGLALCCAFASVAAFAVCAWRFGIPTSESHALMAALVGASLALGGGSPVDAAALGVILAGLALSVALGALFGALISAVFARVLRGAPERLLDGAQIAGAAGMALMHGAQDGQKFVGVLLLANMLARGETQPQAPGVLTVLFCAAVMALGTALGGERIVRRVGNDMARVNKLEGFAADTAGTLCLLLLCVFGVPVSTTHTKTAAILGAARAGGRGRLSYAVFGEMVLAWLITFPACGALAWALTRVFV